MPSAKDLTALGEGNDSNVSSPASKLPGDDPEQPCEAAAIPRVWQDKRESGSKRNGIERGDLVHFVGASQGLAVGAAAVGAAVEATSAEVAPQQAPTERIGTESLPTLPSQRRVIAKDEAGAFRAPLAPGLANKGEDGLVATVDEGRVETSKADEAGVGAPSEAPAKDRPLTRPRLERRRIADDGAVVDVDRLTIPRLPSARKRSSHGVLHSFLVFVVAPTLCAAGYYLFLAKDQFVAEFRFSVTEQTPALPASQQPPSNTMTSSNGSSGNMASVASAVLGSASASFGAVQNFMVADYVLSREAVEELQRRIDIKSLYARAHSDLLFNFSEDAPMEKFLAYWSSMIESYYDPVTGLAFARVRAFTPEDALLVANTLMQLSEKLVNDITNRANNDTVRFAEGEVKRNEARVKEAAQALAEYRKDDNVIDPKNSVVQANISQMISQRSTIAQLETQLASLEAQSLNPGAPVATALRARIEAGNAQLRRIEHEIREQGAGFNGLASVVGRYETLDLERQYANTAYMNSLLALDQARANAAAQHIYLTPYSKPYLPQASTQPKRAQNTLLAFIISFFAWLIGLLIVRSVRDHQL